MPKRYGVVSPRKERHAVRVGSETLEFRGCAATTDSRDAAQEAAGRVENGIFVEREGGTYSQRGAFSIVLGRCRACDEHVCQMHWERGNP